MQLVAVFVLLSIYIYSVPDCLLGHELCTKPDRRPG